MEGTITLDNTVYHPVEARLSALELRIYFNDPGIDRYDFCGFEDEITPVIHLALQSSLRSRPISKAAVSDQGPAFPASSQMRTCHKTHCLLLRGLPP